MEGVFKRGDKVSSVTTGRSVEIQNFLGSGGQGEVYKVLVDGQFHALKWYFDHTATTGQKDGIQKLIDSGPPGESFLWPSEMISAQGSPSFGYLMPLRGDRFKSFTDVVNGRLDPTFKVLMTVGLNLVDSFLKLHAEGLCYRDISFGNGFFDPQTGETIICDNDNVSPNKSLVQTVLGTPDFMAPEVVVRKDRPSRETDYFSLSVLMFYLFHIQHPLLGKKVLAIRSWDLPAREKLFGSEPVFIFDPNDKSNEAIDNPQQDPLGEAGKNALPYWNLVYPTVLKQAFITSFADGIRTPNKRLIATQWKKVLTEARNSIFSCGCGAENFFDRKQPQRKCWNCQKTPALPFRLETEHQVLMLSKDSQLTQNHLENDFICGNSPPIGEVVAHPKRPDVFGLCNRTKTSWSAQPANGDPMVEIPPGRSVPLCDGTKVVIGNFSATIRS